MSYRIVAISDSPGGIFRTEGLDIPQAIELKQQGQAVGGVYSERSVCDCPVCGCVECKCNPDDAASGRTITNEALLDLDVDMLVPAAMENQITGDNASRIAAPMIVEVANGPITSNADEALNSQGTLVVPDIFANAGGVTVSYFEWAQKRAGYYWTQDEVQDGLQRIMAREFNAIYELVKQHGINIRTAADAGVLNRISEAIESQGTGRYFSNGMVSM